MTKLHSTTSLFALTFSAACALSACSATKLGSDYQRPDLQVPTSLPSSPTGSTAAVELLSWWQNFQDPALDALLQEASAHNQDLAVASARIAQARASLEQNDANFYPSVDLNAGASRQRSSQHSTALAAGAPIHTDNRQIGLSASYEIDFWGKYARADEADRALLLGAQAHRATVLTTLYANVARSYIGLAGLDAQLALAEKISGTRTENLHLQQLRFNAGVIGAIELNAAQGEAASATANLAQVRQRHSATQTALAVLLGRKPSEIMQPNIARGKAFDALYAARVIPAQLPADVLNRRPDLLSAEQALIAANADIGQAKAAYFPRLSLTATLGKQSQAVRNLFEPASVFWNMLGNLTQPIFRGGALGALLAAANAQQQQALAQYTLAVQNAFRDVHDALTSVDTSHAAAAQISTRTDALRQSLHLMEVRYQHGYSSYLELLGAQRDLAQVESGLLDLQRAELDAVIGLYTAVGGGWDPKVLATQPQ